VFSIIFALKKGSAHISHTSKPTLCFSYYLFAGNVKKTGLQKAKTTQQTGHDAAAASHRVALHACPRNGTNTRQLKYRSYLVDVVTNKRIRVNKTRARKVIRRHLEASQLLAVYFPSPRPPPVEFSSSRLAAAASWPVCWVVLAFWSPVFLTFPANK